MVDQQKHLSRSPSHGILRALPSGVWVLGFGSLLMDTSSELIHSLLPVFMSSVLGAGMVTIGLVEGLAESAASTSKVFSGFLSDRLGMRKRIVVLGYGLSALAKPIFPLASSIGWVFGARSIDRIGKGIRGAPRDALIADITVPAMRGAAYGLRQALDSVGAFLGPLLAIVFMAWLSNDIRTVLWIGVFPAILAVATLALAVREPQDTPGGRGSRARVRLSSQRELGGRYWLIVVLGAIFALARFSDAFLVLRARDVGLGAGLVPLVMVVMNIVYATSAYPAGTAADRIRRRTLLTAGLIALVGADVILALAENPWHVLGGASLWGLHMGLTQGLFSKMVSEAVPHKLRGSAFGVYHVVTGVALLASSLLAGLLWETVGAAATFLAGAAFACVTMIGVLWSSMRRQRGGDDSPPEG